MLTQSPHIDCANKASDHVHHLLQQSTELSLPSDSSSLDRCYKLTPAESGGFQESLSRSEDDLNVNSIKAHKGSSILHVPYSPWCHLTVASHVFTIWLLKLHLTVALRVQQANDKSYYYANLRVLWLADGFKSNIIQTGHVNMICSCWRCHANGCTSAAWVSICLPALEVTLWLQNVEQVSMVTTWHFRIHWGGFINGFLQRRVWVTLQQGASVSGGNSVCEVF